MFPLAGKLGFFGGQLGKNAFYRYFRDLELIIDDIDKLLNDKLEMESMKYFKKSYKNAIIKKIKAINLNPSNIHRTLQIGKKTMKFFKLIFILKFTLIYYGYFFIFKIFI